MQPGQLAYPLTDRASHCNVPRSWIKQHETGSGLRGGMTTADRDRSEPLVRGQLTSAYFAQAELDRPFRK